MQPLVSVIIPVFNVKQYLCECLDSVLRQSYRNLEIIIVDDGSTDGSGIICDNYQKIDSRIKVIHQENAGLSAARNTGLNAMHGEIVSFLDSDDAFLPGFFHIMVHTMISDNVDIVVCEYYQCFTINRMDNQCKKNVYRLENGYYSSKEALQRMVDNKINHFVWNKIYRSSLFDKLRFPSGYNYEDAILIPRLFEKADLVRTIEKPLLLYRKRPFSITTTPSEKNIRDFITSRAVRADFISKRIPSVFTIKQKERFEEECLQRYIYMYFEIAFSRHTRKTRSILYNEIEKRNAFISECKLKTKVLFYTFRINPFICFVLHKCYRPIGITGRAIRHMFHTIRSNNNNV